MYKISMQKIEVSALVDPGTIWMSAFQTLFLISSDFQFGRIRSWLFPPEDKRLTAVKVLGMPLEINSKLFSVTCNKTSHPQ